MPPPPPPPPPKLLIQKRPTTELAKVVSAPPPTCVMNECEPRVVVRGGGPPGDVANFPYVTTENFTFCM